MGDRANVVIQAQRHGKTPERIYLYTHWSGYGLPIVVRDALALQARWDDDQYLARIVFQAMIAHDHGTTGYGISASLRDNEYPILVLDCATETILVEGEATGSMPFNDYIGLTDDQCLTFRRTGGIEDDSAEVVEEN